MTCLADGLPATKHLVQLSINQALRFQDITSSFVCWFDLWLHNFMGRERSVPLHSDKIALPFQVQGYRQVHSGVSFACLLGISTVYLLSKMINITLRRDSLAN